MFIYVFYSVAVQEYQSVLSMRCRFMCRSAIKFAFILMMVFGIGTLFVNVNMPCQLDHPGQEDELPNIVIETTEKSRIHGE